MHKLTIPSTAVDTVDKSTYAAAPKFPWQKILSFGSNWRYLLTIAIIAIRAFQANAQPMSTWSASSWIFMTMPIWLPTLLGAILLICWFMLWAWANTRKY